MSRIVAAWHGWRAAAETLRCEIVNASPMSAVKEFKRCDIDALLGDRIPA